MTPPQPAALPELPEPELGRIKTDKSNQPAFSAHQIRAALQSQPAAAGVSDAQLRALEVKYADRGFCEDLVHEVFALRPQSESERDLRTRHTNLLLDLHRLAEGEATLCDFDEVKRLEDKLDALVDQLASLRPQAVPMTDAWSWLTEANIDAYLEDYEMRGEDEDGRDACYTPTEGDRALLKDFVMGLLYEAQEAAHHGITAQGAQGGEG